MEDSATPTLYGDCSSGKKPGIMARGRGQEPKIIARRRCKIIQTVKARSEKRYRNDAIVSEAAAC